MSGPPRGSGYSRLQGRLLAWFLAAILLAVGAGVATTWLTDEAPTETPTRVVSRHVQQRVARLWDEPGAAEAYVAELRDTTGLDVRLRREAAPAPNRRGRGGGVVFEEGVTFVPVMKQGRVVGTLEFRSSAPPPRPWRVVVALGAALVVLGLVARRVSIRLATPLVHVASTAERFGRGELAARTGVDAFPRRWVAEEVRDLGVAFDTMAERISRVVLEQRELLAAISHELRSPLGRARVALEIARERTEVLAARASAEPAHADAPLRIERSLDDVDRQLVEIDAILGDLLASARAGLADLRREPNELGAWLHARAAAEDRGPIDVRVDDSARSLTLSIDPALLGRALHNVLANAWAHGHPKDAPIELTLFADDAVARITVRDRGPGFAADLLPRAFDAFVTGTGAARSPKAHGIGLGLALVRRIVEAHGGRVSAENVVSDGRVSGALVTLELPRTAATP